MNWQQACELPYYNGTDLGANYTPAATTFKLWAPTAAAVTVELFATGTDAEPNAHHLGAHHLQSGAGRCVEPDAFRRLEKHLLPLSPAIPRRPHRRCR